MVDSKIVINLKMKWWCKWVFMPMLPSLLWVSYMTGNLNTEKLAKFIAQKGFKIEVGK